MNVRRLFPFTLFALLLAAAIRPTVDPDMWWHLRTGEAILSGGIPRTDLFSFTFPMNEWVTHEWLSQLAMWGLYEFAGFGGLSVFFAVVIAATWGLAYLISDGKPYVAGIVVAVAAMAGSVSWGSRPQMFNLLFLAAFVFLLERRKDSSVGRWAFLAFPVLTVLWANLHSGYLLGIVVLGTYLVGEYLESRRSNPDARVLASRDLRRLLLATAASGAAALINPNGIRLWLYPFETLFSSVQRELIVEWFPPKPNDLIFWLVIGLVVVGIIAFVLGGRRPSITELLMFGGTAFGAFLSLRNIPIFAVVSAPILCRHLAPVFSPARLRGSDRPNAFRRLPTVVAAGAIAVSAAAIATSTLMSNAAAIGNRYPEAAIDWIESEHRTQDRIFNAYTWGGYLIWRGYPVYVDGRADVYGDDGLLAWAKTYMVKPGWEDPLDQHLVDLILVESDSRLAAKLVDAPGWELAYGDRIARVFERDEGPHDGHSVSAQARLPASPDRIVTHVGSHRTSGWAPTSEELSPKVNREPE